MLEIWVHQPIKRSVHHVAVMSENIASYFVMHVVHITIVKVEILIAQGATYGS